MPPSRLVARPARCVVRGALAGGVLAWPRRAPSIPNVAPRAAALEREGERQMAIDLLGHYLATAPGRRPGLAAARPLLPLRRPRLAPPRPPAAIPTASSISTSPPPRSTRRSGCRSTRAWSSAASRRSTARLVAIETAGWDAARYARPRPDAPADARRSLSSWAPTSSPRVRPAASSSPAAISKRSRSGTAAWNAPSLDVLPIRPDLYATDSLYRSAWPRRWAWIPRCRCSARSAAVARQPDPVPEPVDRSAPRRRRSALGAVPAGAGQPTAGAGPEALSITELLKAARQARSPWVQDVRGVYEARRRATTLLLCSSLLLFFGDTPPPACRP